MAAIASQSLEAAEQSERMARYTRRVLVVLTAATVLALLCHLAILTWARHEFTQVESVDANHSSSLASGRGFYFQLQNYPYTVTAYTPLFYLVQAGLFRCGLPIFTAGRLISFFALLGVIFLSGRLLRLYVSDRYCVWAGTLLVASTANLLVWGTTGQVDVLALLFSMAAFYEYSQYYFNKTVRHLWWTGFFLALAGLTKQTMIAA